MADTRTYLAAGAVSWPLLYLLYRLRARGVEQLPVGGFVVAANHTSSFDPWPLGMPLWPRRQLYFMAKAELFNPLLAPLLRAFGAFPVRRGERDVQAIETAVRLCREGKVVAMFPEGTRREKGLRKKFEPRARTGSRGSGRSGSGTASRSRSTTWWTRRHARRRTRLRSG